MALQFQGTELGSPVLGLENIPKKFRVKPPRRNGIEESTNCQGQARSWCAPVLTIAKFFLSQRVESHLVLLDLA